MKTLRNLIFLTVVTITGAVAGVQITFDLPSQTAQPGDTLHYFGTIYNTGPDEIYLNANSFNLSLTSSDFTLNDLFLVNAPLSLAANTNSGSIELFQLQLSNPFASPFSIYTGNLTLLGGPDDQAQDVLGGSDFNVTVATVPEPSAVLLLGAVIAYTLPRLRRKAGRLTT